jgi:hypothetical protein
MQQATWVLTSIEPSLSRLLLPLQQNTFAISDMPLASHYVPLRILIVLYRWMI